MKSNCKTRFKITMHAIRLFLYYGDGFKSTLMKSEPLTFITELKVDNFFWFIKSEYITFCRNIQVKL